MNELYFFLQILTVIGFTFGALYFGKAALTTAVTVEALLANLFVLKQMHFLGFEVTCSDAYAIGSILSLNLLREHYGKEAAKKAISICLFFMIFFTVAAKTHLQFIPSSHDLFHPFYVALLTPAPRLLLASLLVFFLIQHFDNRFFGTLSKVLPKSSFLLRSSLSLIVSQLLDTLLFSFLGLYGIVSHIFHVILISFLIKVCAIFTMGPLMTFFTQFIPFKKETEDEPF